MEITLAKITLSLSSCFKVCLIIGHKVSLCDGCDIFELLLKLLVQSLQNTYKTVENDIILIYGSFNSLSGTYIAKS